jgi:AcrR family transcriptional regulator
MMGAATPSAARDRILETASALFYAHGINNVGIDAVIARSGVAKMTLYRHFPSKDRLVLAFLEKIDADWTAWLRARVEAAGPGVQARPLAVFDALGEWFETPAFRGCPFISTAAEIHDPAHPVARAAWRFKWGLREYFSELLREAGYSRSDALADQFLLLADGAIVRAAMAGGSDAAASARAAAEALLAQAASPSRRRARP